jgi:hypothetical protein
MRHHRDAEATQKVGRAEHDARARGEPILAAVAADEGVRALLWLDEVVDRRVLALRALRERVVVARNAPALAAGRVGARRRPLAMLAVRRERIEAVVVDRQAVRVDLTLLLRGLLGALLRGLARRAARPRH